MRAVSLGLTPLVPVFNKEQHGTYSDELVELLKSDERRARVWNMALAGGYGSGKSSILAGVRDQLPDRVVEISLSSLSDVGVLPFPKGSEDLQNYIQKEIVKQLLYRERPSRVPGSRFKRISRMSHPRALGYSALAGVVVVGVLWITGWGAPFKLPASQEWQRSWLLLAAGVAAAGVAYLFQALFHNRLRIEKLGTAATSVSLSADAPAGSYFDEYLDEIVYFFEKTRRDVVILEDLDRFEDPGIYASLRELNTILNSSAQLRKRPVHFIYAVRDSIFKDLERAGTPETATPAATDAEEGVWQADRALSDAATQRTKFFDLVVPIVPFITHRSSADLLLELVRDVDRKVRYEAIRVVAKHVTDMRLLHNILNEYRIFRARVLGPGKLRGLSETGLFSLVAYKNTHLEDFELISVGSSTLDVIYRESRKVITANIERLSTEVETRRASVEPDHATVERARQLGAALQDLVERWLVISDHPAHSGSYLLGGIEQPGTSLTTVEFWERFIDSAETLEIRIPGERVFSLTPETLGADLGPIVPRHWVQQAQEDVRHALDDARSAQRWVLSADFADLLAPQYPLERDGAPEDFEAWLRANVAADPLLLDMLKGGLLDRNFALYGSEFYGVVASANAMNFVVQHVQTDRPDYDYALTPQEVATVLDLGGPRVFEALGIFNIAIYDYLLSDGDARLDSNLQLLAVGSLESLDFIRAYMRRGAKAEALIRRLAEYWPDVFTFVEAETAGDATRSALLLAAFLGIAPAVEYHVPESVKRILAAGASGIPDLVDEGRSPQRAVAALEQLGIRLPGLASLSPAAQSALVAARRYEVNTPNLEIAIGANGDIALDTIMGLDDPTFDHVLGNFRDYLRTLDQEKRSSISDVARTVEVLEAVDRLAPGSSIDVARRMSAGMMVRELKEVSPAIMSVLAQARRFPLTFANVTEYIAMRSLDEDLVGYLVESPTLAVPEETDPAALESLASALLADQSMSVATRVELAEQLVDLVPLRAAIASDAEMITALRSQGLLEDDLATFNSLSSVEAQQAFIVASETAADWLSSGNATAELVAQLLHNPDVPPRVQSRIVHLVPGSPAWTATDVLEAIGEWAATNAAPLPADTLQIIQTSGVSTRSKVAALNASVDVVPGLVAQYVSQLDGEYPTLLQRGHGHVDIPVDPDPTRILELLRDTDTAVSSFTRVDDVWRVRQRHPLT